MTLYTLLSDSCALLPMQLAAIRRFLPDVSRIVVAHGGSGVSITAVAAARLGVDVMGVPDEKIAGHFGFRAYSIADFIWRNRCRDDSHLMIIHGDLLPTAAMPIASLLDGYPIAGRAHRIRGFTRTTLTWLAVDLSRVGDLSFTPDHPEGTFGGYPIREYGANRPAAEVEGLPATHQWERCEPGWLHVDKLSVSAMGGEATRAFGLKLEAAQREMRGLGIAWEDADPCEAVAYYQPSLMRGAMSATKAILGVGRAADGVIEQRKAICETCPELTTGVVGVKECRVCGCVYRLKIINAEESCPLGKWPASEILAGGKAKECAPESRRNASNHEDSP